MDINESLGSWSTALKGRGHRPRGIERYCWIVRTFLLQLNPTVVDQRLINERTITAYRDQMAERCTVGTTNNFLTAIRSFCRWAIRAGLRRDDPTATIDWARKTKRLPRAVPQQTLRFLWRTLADRGDTPEWTWRRNRRAIYILYFAGLRLFEASALLWEDVDFDDDSIRVNDGKGGSPRLVPLHPALREELELVPLTKRHPSHAVAGKKSGRPLSSKSMAHIFELWLRKRGIKISAHRLRHTFATQMLRHGADIRRIQELLGHAQLSTTEIYLYVDVEHMRDAINTLPSEW